MSQSIEQLTPETSFEAVIAATQGLISRMEDGSDEPDQLQQEIVHLLNLNKGPRGFFASLLTDARSVADSPPAYLLGALAQVPEVTAELLAKNLAMSSAMVIHHGRNQDDTAMNGSRQVQRRCEQLIRQLSLPALHQELSALATSVKGDGTYSAFLQRWHYDDDQRAEIGRVVQLSLDAIAS